MSFVLLVQLHQAFGNHQRQPTDQPRCRRLGRPRAAAAAPQEHQTPDLSTPAGETSEAQAAHRAIFWELKGLDGLEKYRNVMGFGGINVALGCVLGGFVFLVDICDICG